jgi:hypothetical protein
MLQARELSAAALDQVGAGMTGELDQALQIMGWTLPAMDGGTCDTGESMTRPL